MDDKEASKEYVLQLNRDRQKAVRDAWKREIELIKEGKGTRDWTPDEQRQLLERGRVNGVDGHHMKSVNAYPQHAGDFQNIQFLTPEEHLEAHNSGVHKSGYHSATNGYYEPKTKMMHSFGDQPPHVPIIELSKPVYKEKNTELHQIQQQEKAVSQQKKQEIIIQRGR